MRLATLARSIGLHQAHLIVQADEGLRFTIDSCQPDGEVLAEILDSYVVFSAETELSRKIDQLGEIANKSTLARLKTILLPT